MNRGVKGSHLASGLLIFLALSMILVAVKPIYGQPTSVIPTSTCDPKNLTGKWRANDGATYFIRQIGDQIWWFGARSLQEGTPFSNVLHGKITLNYPPPSGSPHIFGMWLDVPLGAATAGGNLGIKIDPSGQKLTKLPEDQSTRPWEKFSATEWIKNCRTLGDILKGPAK